MDKLTSMQVFLEVARRGSFAAAADQLGISRAMVTRHVMHLENTLGVRLLHRTTRRLSLTGEGQSYAERCQQILEEIEESEYAVAQMSALPRGTLRVSAPISFGTFHLAPAIAAYQDAYAEVAVEVVLNDRDTDLAEEGIDVAVRVGALEESRLIARRIGTSHMVVCAAPAYLSRRGTPQVPADLSTHNCLRYTLRSSVWRFAQGGEEATVLVHGDLECNGGDVLRLAALAGRGLVLLPTYMVGADLRAGRLRRVLRDFEMPEVPIHALYLHRRHLSAKVRSFVEFLARRYAERPDWADPLVESDDPAVRAPL